MELTPITPTALVQPPGEDLRNAAAMASAARQFLERPGKDPEDWLADFARIEQLIQSALEKLAEPHPVTIDRAAAILGVLNPTDREARDAAAVITSAALEWR